MTDVAQRVRNIIASDLGVPVDDVKDAVPLAQLAPCFEGRLRAVIHVERALGVTLTDEDIEFATVGRLVERVTHLHLALRP